MKECSSCGACYDDASRFCGNDGTELLASLPGGRELDGRWRLERVVGVGRQGSVYAASDARGGRAALVKTLLPTLFYEAGVLDTLLADAERVRALRHPNAGEVFAAGKLPNGGAYIASEYLEGRSLKRALADDGPMEPGRAIGIAIAAADALGAAHALKILHRDVKPDNVILEAGADGGGERPRLVDFGVARWTSGRGGSSVTATGSIVIRMPHYASPEQCKGEELGTASDVYSLAVVLYEMLVGRVPFDAPSPMAVIVKHVTETPESPRALRGPEVPEAVDRAIMRALAKSPADRPSDGAAFAASLRAALAEERERAAPAPAGVVGAPPPRAAGPSAAAPSAQPPRAVPPPPEPVHMRLTIVDADNESHTSRRIDGAVHDFGENGMRLQTGTIETGQLNIIRDHTTAFKNRLEVEVDLPDGVVRASGFAAWYRPAPDGINWNVGFYIRDMSSADRARYNAYLKGLSAAGA